MKNDEVQVNEIVDGITVDEALQKYEPMVHRFVNAARTNHVCSYEDLVQEGRLAIVVAFQNYDPDKGASLTTWTYHMIKDSIAEYQKQHLSILSGGSYLQSILRKAGKDATIEEIMEYGISKKTAMAATYIKDSFSTADYEELATVIGDDGLKTNLDSLDWQKYLTKSEVFAVENFFGFNGDRMTMAQIGDKIGKSRKGVSYLLNKAINKLKRIPGIEEYAFV